MKILQEETFKLQIGGIVWRPDYFLVLFWLIEFVHIELGSREAPAHIGRVLDVAGVEGSGGKAVHHHPRVYLREY